MRGSVSGGSVSGGFVDKRCPRGRDKYMKLNVQGGFSIFIPEVGGGRGEGTEKSPGGFQGKGNRQKKHAWSLQCKKKSFPFGFQPVSATKKSILSRGRLERTTTKKQKTNIHEST